MRIDVARAVWFEIPFTTAPVIPSGPLDAFASFSQIPYCMSSESCGFDSRLSSGCTGCRLLLLVPDSAVHRGGESLRQRDRIAVGGSGDAWLTLLFCLTVRLSCACLSHETSSACRWTHSAYECRCGRGRGAADLHAGGRRQRRRSRVAKRFQVRSRTSGGAAVVPRDSNSTPRDTPIPADARERGQGAPVANRAASDGADTPRR